MTLNNKEHIDPYLQDDGRPANKDPTDCTTVYQSGNARAKRHQAYDIQGVGSLVCRHYFVLGIFHLWHGERYGYILGLLVWFVAMATARGVDLNGAVIPFFYDVACRYFSRSAFVTVLFWAIEEIAAAVIKNIKAAILNLITVVSSFLILTRSLMLTIAIQLTAKTAKGTKKENS